MIERGNSTLDEWKQWVLGRGIQGVIFDLDGTLVDSLPLHLDLWNELLRPLGHAITPGELEAVTGAPLEQIAARWVQRWNLPVTPDELVRQKRKRLSGSWHRLKPHPDGAGLARTLGGLLPLAIGTGAPGDLARIMLRVVGLAPLFPIIVSADEVSNPKPHPETFLSASQRLGLNPAQVLVVEDGALGMQAARDAGMPLIDVRALSLPPVLE